MPEIPRFGIPYEQLALDNYKPEDLNRMSEAQLRGLLHWKENSEELQAADPVNYGYTLQNWRKVMGEWNDYKNHIIFGGNRSSKSTFASRMVMLYAQMVPEAEIRCFSVNDSSSINDQQRMVWEALPQVYKNLTKKKGDNYSVQYSQKNGFTSGKLILPPQEGYKRGSSVIFQTYKSFQLDAQIAEGWKAHLIWADEEIPLNLFKTLQLRLTDYLEAEPFNSKMLLTFTTLKGWTSLINDLCAGAKTLKTRWSDILKEDIPYEQESRNWSQTKLHYFWTQDNPFLPKSSLKQFEGRPRSEIMARAHGICTKSMETALPKFSRESHVVKQEDLPWIKNPDCKVTHYQALDPAGSKHWYFIYAGVVQGLSEDEPEIYVWAEFPDQSYGAWGVANDKPQGAAGPAMKGSGLGIVNYVALMHRIEEEMGADIFEYGVDKRFARHTITGQMGDTRLLDELLKAGKRYITPVAHKADVSGTSKTEIELGVQEINNRLDYNTEIPIDATNRPRLFISEQCENLIQCMENYTAAAGPNEVWKDGVDCIRILLDMEPRCVDWHHVPKRRVGRGY